MSDYPFSININKDEMVYNLKDAIKRNESSLAGFDSGALEIWKVNVFWRVPTTRPNILEAMHAHSFYGI